MEVRFDTTDRKKSRVALLKGGKVIGETETSGDILAAFVSLLKEKGFSVSDIKKVSANRGPGSFTGIRIGLSIANALIYALGLKQAFLKPLYGRAPNISKPKKS